MSACFCAGTSQASPQQALGTPISPPEKETNPFLWLHPGGSSAQTLVPEPFTHLESGGPQRVFVCMGDIH